MIAYCNSKCHFHVFFFREIVLNLKEKKRVAVIASTGMAATQLGPDATTLHHWSRLGDVRLTQEELNTTFLVDDIFAKARKRIAATDVLAKDISKKRNGQDRTKVMPSKS